MFALQDVREQLPTPELQTVLPSGVVGRTGIHRGVEMRGRLCWLDKVRHTTSGREKEAGLSNDCTAVFS